MISTLITAWILTLFDLDEIIIDAINQLFNTSFNTNVYWLAFLIIGLIGNIIDK